MRAMRSFLLLSVGASFAAAQPGPSVPLPEGTKVLKDLAYVAGGHERQKLDLYLPSSGTRWPLVVSNPPFLIVHGDADLLVPHHQSVLLEAALKKAGVSVRLVTVPGGPHGGETVKQGLPTALDFLTATLRP
jgi:acetyl esterase/lipase